MMKVQQKDPFAVSDALVRIRLELIKYEIDGVCWSAKEVRDLNEHLRILAVYGRAIGNELVRLRWNERGALESQTIDHVGGNVIAFPHLVQPEPPKGGAA